VLFSLCSAVDRQRRAGKIPTAGWRGVKASASITFMQHDVGMQCVCLPALASHAVSQGWRTDMVA